MDPALSSSHNGDFELSPIKAIELAARRIPGSISLAQGIPSFRTPRAVQEFVIEKINEGACDKYSLTNGLLELREEISLALQKEGLSYDPDREIIVTAGSIEGIAASVLASTSPGDEVIIPSPTYASYLGCLRLARCVPRYVELDEEQNFDFHVERLESAITPRTRAVLYCSPNNPTGTLFSEEKTRRLMQLAERHDLTVIIDEVYKDFYYTSDPHFSPALIPEARKRVIRVCSFSKAFAMTGWRVGFLHADASVASKILKYHDALVTCAPVASQYGAIAALRYGESYLREFREEFKKRRDYTIGMLDRMSHVLDYQVPLATYFVFPRIKDTIALARDSRKLAYDILERAKVAVVPGSAFGPSGESHLRITFGREPADLEEGLQRLFSYFSEERGKRAPLSPRAGSSGSALRSGGARAAGRGALAAAARHYVSRHKPLVIGIAGTLGKTVYKRAINAVLSRHRATRSTLLSYNTRTGLPLSILGLHPPKTNRERALFPFKLLGSAVFPSRPCKILILEYGVSDARDADALLSVANPDWLVLTGVRSGDPSLDESLVADGLERLASRLPPARILWSAEDAAMSSVRSDLDPALALRSGLIQGDTLQLPHPYKLAREPVGESARLAALAAVLLAERIGMSPQSIQSALDSSTA